MCIGTVRSGKREIRDVVLMEEEGDGYVVTTLLGERERVRGKIRKIDLENHLILVE
jgi:predicted RNA-binding protein